ncbi:MAG: hypothetical protein JSW28_06695, partial [Thermoplasmata archaeon]
MRRVIRRILCILICVLVLGSAYLTSVPLVSEPHFEAFDEEIKEELQQAAAPAHRGTRAQNYCTIFNEAPPTDYYYSGYAYRTFGIRLQVYQTITVDQIGYYRHSNSRPYYFYNCRIWTDTGGLMYSQDLGSPDQPGEYSWHFKDISPLTLTPDKYIVSVYVRGYAYHGIQNPGPTPDGIIDPMGFYQGYGNSFPNNFVGTDFVPFVDIRYSSSGGPKSHNIYVPDDYGTIQEA